MVRTAFSVRFLSSEINWLTHPSLYTGFKNAKDMAEKYRNSPTVLNDPMKNADSNALFAVGAWIISQTGVAINQDGTFTNPQTNPKARRGLKRFKWQAGRVQVI